MREQKFLKCERCGEPGKPELVVTAWGSGIGDYNTGYDAWTLCEKCRGNMAVCEGCGAYMLDEVQYDPGVNLCPVCVKQKAAEAVIERLPKCWRRDEDGEMVRDVPVVPGVTLLYGICETGDSDVGAPPAALIEARLTHLYANEADWLLTGRQADCPSHCNDEWGWTETRWCNTRKAAEA